MVMYFRDRVKERRQNKSSFLGDPSFVRTSLLHESFVRKKLMCPGTLGFSSLSSHKISALEFDDLFRHRSLDSSEDKIFFMNCKTKHGQEKLPVRAKIKYIFS